MGGYTLDEIGLAFIVEYNSRRAMVESELHVDKLVAEGAIKPGIETARQRRRRERAA